MKKSIYIYSFVLLLPFLISSQEAPIVKENLPIIIKAHIGIPKTISSNQFRQSFNGFYEADVSINFKLVHNFYLGIGYQNSYFQNNKFLQPKRFNTSIVYNTRLIGDCPFVKVGFDKFFKSNAYINYSLNYGYMLARYTNINEDSTAINKPFGAKTFAAQYIQPEVSFNFIVGDKQRIAFSLLFGYTTLISKYDPKAPRFNQFDEVRLKSNNYYMSWFTFGFGINVLLGNNKK